jgi:putative MFS transporter
MEMTDLTEDNIQSPEKIEKGKLFRSTNSNEKITFDCILNRVGFGKYHYKLFVILGLLGIVDGSASMVVSFILPVFKKQFTPNFDFQAILGTCIYIGCLIGSLLSGQFSDRYGRRRPILYSNFSMLILGTLTGCISNIILFICLQAIVGLVVGIFSPLSHTIMAEITPLKYRGKYMVLLGVNYVIGQIICVLIAIFTLDTLDSGNWHALLLGSVMVPALFAWIAALCFLDESARHEMVLGNYSSGIAILKKMYTDNQGLSGENLMTLKEEEELIMGFKNLVKDFGMKTTEASESKDIKSLFRGELKKVTPFVWLNWFTNSLTFFGLNYLLPTTYLLLSQQTNTHNTNNNGSQSVVNLIYPCIMELPSMLVAALLVDLKGFGRKNSLTGTFFLGGIFCIIAYCQVYPSFQFWISSTKFFFALAFTLNYQLTSELYPTKVRGTSMGMASAFGRIGGIIMPYVTEVLGNREILLPYLVFGFFSLGASLGTFSLPYDTSNLEFSELDAKN